MIDKIKRFLKSKTAVFIEILIILVCALGLCYLNKPKPESTISPLDLSSDWDTETLEEKVPGYRYNYNRASWSEVLDEGPMENLADALMKEDCWWYGVDDICCEYEGKDATVQTLDIRTNNVEVASTSSFKFINIPENPELLEYKFGEMLNETSTVWDKKSSNLYIREAKTDKGKYIIYYLAEDYILNLRFKDSNDYSKFCPIIENALGIQLR